VWPDQKQLDAYLKRLEEIEKRDHRVLGQEARALSASTRSWAPAGAVAPEPIDRREELEAWWRQDPP
jgi:threonyl-tRNA synthetase